MHLSIGISIFCVLLFMTMYGHIISALFFGSTDIVANAGIFTRGYPFTLPGEGYGKKLYPLTGIVRVMSKLGGHG